MVETRYGNKAAKGEGQDFSENLINQFEESVIE